MPKSRPLPCSDWIHNWRLAGRAETAGGATIDKLEHVTALKVMIEKRDLVFEVPTGELHDLYVYLLEQFPDVLDALLTRRLALAGVE